MNPFQDVELYIRLPKKKKTIYPKSNTLVKNLVEKLHLSFFFGKTHPNGLHLTTHDDWIYAAFDLTSEEGSGCVDWSWNIVAGAVEWTALRLHKNGHRMACLTYLYFSDYLIAESWFQFCSLQFLVLGMYRFYLNLYYCSMKLKKLILLLDFHNFKCSQSLYYQRKSSPYALFTFNWI